MKSTINSLEIEDINIYSNHDDDSLIVVRIVTPKDVFELKLCFYDAMGMVSMFKEHVKSPSPIVWKIQEQIKGSSNYKFIGFDAINTYEATGYLGGSYVEKYIDKGTIIKVN